MMIKALFLDFEGVVTNNGHTLHTTLFKEIKPFMNFEELNRRYKLAKVGELSFEKYLSGVSEEKKLSYLKMVRYHKGSREALKELSKTYSLFLASNHVPVCFEKEIEKLKCEKYFKDAFVSYKIKTTKPKKEFFEKMLKLSGFQPHESIFVDDAKDNLVVASELGINIVWMDNKDVTDYRNKTSFQPKYVINDLRELKKVIKKFG